MTRDFLVDADIIQLHFSRYCEFRVNNNKIRAQANFEFLELPYATHKFDAVKFDNERMKFVMIKL